MNSNENIEEILSRMSFRKLSTDEQNLVWQNIAKKQTPSLSLLKLTLNKNMITSLIIALALTLGVGGTVVTADSARPGDTLFGIDQAVESIRLKLAGEDKKNELRIKFAEERVQEVEELTKENSSMSRPAAEDISETSVSEIEADVFKNETVIKIKYNDNKKFVFTSEAKTKEEITLEITKAFPVLSKVFVESKLNLETEDRESKQNDKALSANMHTFKEEERNRISLGLDAALTLLNGVSASLDVEKTSELKLITDELNDYIKNLPADTELKFSIQNGKDRIRIELESEDGRIKVEVKDGDKKIKTEDEDDSDDDQNDDEDIENTVQGEMKLEIKASVFGNETVVKVELNDQKTSFTTSALTKADIIGVIKEKFPVLTVAQIEKALKIEIEDRDSLLEDLLGESSDDDADDTEIENEDEDDSDNDENDNDNGDDEDDNSGQNKENNDD